MKLIDKYILFKFLKTYFFVVLLLGVIAVVIDYTEKSDHFLDAELTFWEIVDQYSLNFFIQMTSILSPMSIFITAVFVTARLSAHSETVAILTSGYSFKRFLLPFFVGSFIIAIITFALVAFIIPNAAKEKIDFEVKYLKAPYYFTTRNVHLKNQDSTYFYLQSYINRNKTGYRFTYETTDGTELINKISSDRVIWDSTERKWFLPDFREVRFEGDEEIVNYGKNKYLELNITPEYFENRHGLNEAMTLPELSHYIRNERARGVGNLGLYLHERYERYGYPLTIIILTMMGVIVASRKTKRGSSATKIGLGFILAFVFILMVIVARSVSKSGAVDPVYSAFTPSVIFTIVTIYLFIKTPK
jgi:lipopolysaccharide export system permease protein